MLQGQDRVFDGKVPEVYDTYLVPLIFQDYANDLAALVAERAPGAVLETAAGSGVVTRALAPLLPPGARYTVSDLNPAMLARARAMQPAGATLEWQVADALDLPYADGSFDVVCCQFGAMFFPDRAAGFAEARRVLRPGGALIFNVWDRIEENGFADLVTRVSAEIWPEDPPRFLARTPHGYHDRDEIAHDLRAGGFTLIEMESVTHFSRAETARIPAVAYCRGTPLRTEIEARGDLQAERATDLSEARITRLYGTGPVSATIRAHVVVAV